MGCLRTSAIRHLERKDTVPVTITLGSSRRSQLKALVGLLKPPEGAAPAATDAKAPLCRSPHLFFCFVQAARYTRALPRRLATMHRALLYLFLALAATGELLPLGASLPPPAHG